MRKVSGATDKVVIVGAGLGGLSAALRLAGGQPVRLPQLAFRRDLYPALQAEGLVPPPREEPGAADRQLIDVTPRGQLIAANAASKAAAVTDNSRAPWQVLTNAASNCDGATYTPCSRSVWKRVAYFFVSACFALS